MKQANTDTRTGYSNVDILANAHISEKSERLRIAEIAPELLAHIILARLDGYRPVCVYWPDGKTALLLIPAEATMPQPDRIIAAYRECEKTDKIFPEGVQSWGN